MPPLGLCPSLKCLDLSGNRLICLDSHFDTSMPRWIRLRGNQLDDVPDLRLGWVFLDLSCNPVSARLLSTFLFRPDPDGDPAWALLEDVLPHMARLDQETNAEFAERVLRRCREVHGRDPAAAALSFVTGVTLDVAECLARRFPASGSR